MSHGFVYLLGNKCMPDIFKVGCTERSPRQRADELSGSTGVPVPFDLICYVEVPDFQGVERTFHRWLDDNRVSPQREFFRVSNVPYVVGLFMFHPKQSSFGFGAKFGSYADAKEIVDPWKEPKEPSQEGQPTEPVQEVGDGPNQNDQA